MVHATIARPDSDDDGDIALDTLGGLDAAAPTGLAPAPQAEDRGFSISDSGAAAESSDSDGDYTFGWDKKGTAPATQPAAKPSPLGKDRGHTIGSGSSGRTRTVLAPASKPPRSNGTTAAFSTRFNREKSAATDPSSKPTAPSAPVRTAAGPGTCLTTGTTQDGPAEEARVREECKLVLRDHAILKLDPDASARIPDRYLLDAEVFARIKSFRGVKGGQKGPHPGLLDNSRIAEGTPLRLRRFMTVPDTHFVVLLPVTWFRLAGLFGGGGRECGFSEATYHRLPRLDRATVMALVLSLHRVASIHRLPRLDRGPLAVVLKTMLRPVRPGLDAELKVPVIPGYPPIIEFTPLSLKVTWMHKSLAGTKMQTVGMFETSRLATMSDFTRQLALHFELATDAKIGLSMMHKGTPVTSMNVLTNEMSLAMRVLDGAGDDSGGCGSDSDDLPNDTCFKRRHSSSAGSSFPGRGRQLGNSNGSSSFQNGSNSPPWSASRSSSPPGWEIGCRKQSAGLGNLGNTCFMNSSLQCLANIKEFKDFFLTGRHVPEINRWNPIGHRGELAQAYADTVKAMWSTGSTSHAPRKLKETVGRCESRFQGYEQHDSQEFISFLLDGLHEDLNRVQDKPVVPAVETEHLTDEEGARQSWEAWKLRNDSKIVDLFSGQFKSTVQCPSCNKVSVTFDPYMVLSLPLPEQLVTLKIRVVWADGARRPTMYAIELKKGAVPKDEVLQKVSELSQVRTENLVCYKFETSTTWKPYTYEPLTNPRDKVEPDERSHDENEFVIYELDPRPSHRPARTTVLWVRYKLLRHGASSKRNDDYIRVFEHPFLLTFTDEDLEADDFKFGPAAICRKFMSASKFAQVREHDGNKYSPSSSPDGSPARSGNGELEKDKLESKTALLADTTMCWFIDEDGDFVKTGSPETSVALNFNSRREAENFIDRYRASSTLHRSATDSDCGNDHDRITMQDCLELFQQQQVLDEDNLWYCSSCKEHKQASKRLEVWSLPDVLVIHLKRFSYTKYSRDKISTRVDFPIEGLNLQDYIKGPESDAMMCNYDLVGVSHHSGYLGGGHYTATGKSPVSGEWCNFDDSYVTSTDASTARSNTSYVLFYRRKCSPRRDAEEAVIAEATLAAAKVAAAEIADTADDQETQESTSALDDAQHADEKGVPSAFPFGAGNRSLTEAASDNLLNPFTASPSPSPTAAGPPPPPPPPPPLDELDDEAEGGGFMTPPPDPLPDAAAQAAPPPAAPPPAAPSPAAPPSAEEIAR